MLFDEKLLQQTKAAEPAREWPLNYYMELKPEKRKALLEEQMRQGRSEELEQIEKLFQIRYISDKKGNYADTFMRSYLELRMTAEKMDVMFAERRNKKIVLQALHHMQADGTSEIPEELVYQELCHLISLYVQSSVTDKNYTSILWGMFKNSDEKILEKMRRDLAMIGEALPEMLHLETECRILSKAIADTKARYFV